MTQRAVLLLRPSVQEALQLSMPPVPCLWLILCWGGRGNKPDLRMGCGGGRAQSTKFMLGIILAVLCSNWVGEMIHSDGVYETDLDADGSVIFLRPSPPPALFAKDAGMIMSRAVWCAWCRSCLVDVECQGRVRHVCARHCHVERCLPCAHGGRGKATCGPLRACGVLFYRHAAPARHNDPKSMSVGLCVVVWCVWDGV